MFAIDMYCYLFFNLFIVFQCCRDFRLVALTVHFFSGSSKLKHSLSLMDGQAVALFISVVPPSKRKLLLVGGAYPSVHRDG